MSKWIENEPGMRRNLVADSKQRHWYAHIWENEQRLWKVGRWCRVLLWKIILWKQEKKRYNRQKIKEGCYLLMSQSAQKFLTLQSTLIILRKVMRATSLVFFVENASARLVTICKVLFVGSYLPCFRKWLRQYKQSHVLYAAQSHDRKRMFSEWICRDKEHVA